MSTGHRTGQLTKQSSVPANLAFPVWAEARLQESHTFLAFGGGSSDPGPYLSVPLVYTASLQTSTTRSGSLACLSLVPSQSRMLLETYVSPWHRIKPLTVPAFKIICLWTSFPASAH